MIRLGSPIAAKRLELAYGVVVMARINDPVADSAARSALGQALRAQGQDTDIAAAKTEAAIAYACRAIESWEGVAQADGSPAPCEPLLIEQAMREVPTLLDVFVTQRNIARWEWSAEGSASAASPNGTGGRARGTAKAAAR
jgi:hypothetical protein